MADTLTGRITDTAIDLTADLENSAGTATALSDGSFYTLQNTGGMTLFIFEGGATAPAAVTGAWTFVRSGRFHTLKPDGDAMWCRTLSNATDVSVNFVQ